MHTRSVIIQAALSSSSVIETESPTQYAGFKDILQNGFNARHKQKCGFINHITGADHFLLLFLDNL